MATTKVTFTLDEATIAQLDDAAARLRKPKCEIVREAIHDDNLHIGRMSDAERVHNLRVLDELLPTIRLRRQAETTKELAEIREARRQVVGDTRIDHPRYVSSRELFHGPRSPCPCSANFSIRASVWCYPHLFSRSGFADRAYHRSSICRRRYFPSEEALVFGAVEAWIAANVYRSVRRAAKSISRCRVRPRSRSASVDTPSQRFHGHPQFDPGGRLIAGRVLTPVSGARISTCSSQSGAPRSRFPSPTCRACRTDRAGPGSSR